MNGSPGVARVVAAARAAAAAQRHAFVAVEHLFAGLLDDPGGLAATLLSRAGFDPARLRADVLSGLRKAAPGEAVAADALPVSRLAQKVLDAAAASGAAAEREPGERELLAALLADPRGRVSRMLPADGPGGQAIRAALGIEAGGAAPAARAAARAQPPATGQPDGAEAARRRPREQAAAGGRKSRAETRAGPAEPARAAQAPIAPVALQPQGGRGRRWLLLLLLGLPIAFLLNLSHASPVAVFAAACLAVLPLAGLMGEATEALAEHTGPTVGGLLNATFGNAAELIIALVALRSGLVDLVKASITGSILGNLLLILGLSCIAAGAGQTTVRFSRTNAGMSAAMLALAVIGLVFPALLHFTRTPPSAAQELYLSEAVAAILIITYLLSLVFSLRTHKSLFGGAVAGTTHHVVEWRVTTAVGVLAAATAGVVVASELLVHSIEGVTARLGLSEAFLGLVVIPLIGNAAEHASAVVVARKGQMDLAFQIALGSSTQIALLVAPLLVFAGLGLGTRMDLVFPPFEVLALAVATGVIALITLDGETHWFEGAQLLAVYGLFAAAALLI